MGKQVDKHLPLSLRQKLRQEFKSKPRIFEVIPSSGILAPGERLNLQVKFAPAEEVRLVLVLLRDEVGSVVL